MAIIGKIPIKTMVLAFGKDNFILDVSSVSAMLGDMDRQIHVKMNNQIIKLKMSAILAFTLSANCQVYRIADMILVDMHPFVAKRIKNESHMFSWVYAAKRYRDWTDIKVFDFGLLIEKLYPSVPDVHLILDDCLNDWTEHEAQEFFSVVGDLSNNLRCMLLQFIVH